MSTIEDIDKISEEIQKEKSIFLDLTLINENILSTKDPYEKNEFLKKFREQKEKLKKENLELKKRISGLELKKFSSEKEKENFEKNVIEYKKEQLSDLERNALERLKLKNDKVEKKVEKKPSKYYEFANKLFAEKVKIMLKEQKFRELTQNLVKSNLEYTSITYISLMFLNTILSFFIALIVFAFFLNFNLVPEFPIIAKVTEPIALRLVKLIWIPIGIPIFVYLFMYSLPSLEKKSLEKKIDAELPFVAIHMSAISGSMIDPVKIFSIIVSTKEYPNVGKEFNKLLNEINIYGYDLVTALKDIALNTPSQKLSELFNGLSTTITSGGNLYNFFDKRAQTLLLDYRLEKEKEAKSAETFMDMYISIVIATPMVLMLLLVMMKISGIGISLPTEMITFLVVGAVSLINIFFLLFLQVKQSDSGE
jgi:Flp pilus assembly protein TadB